MIGYETDIAKQINLTTSAVRSPGVTTGNDFPNTGVAVVAQDALSLAKTSGNVCFGIEFKDCLPVGILRDVHTDDFISVKSGGVSLGCGEIEYCSGFYKYTLANDTFVQYNRQSNASKGAALIAVLDQLETLDGLTPDQKQNLSTTKKAVSIYSGFISKGYGIYHFSRRHDSYTAQLWLSNIPDSDNGCLNKINLFKNSTAVANLVLDGVYGGKCNKGKYGSTRYTGSIIGDTVVNEMYSSIPTAFYKDDLETPVRAPGKARQGYVSSQTKKSFGTISLNISVPQ
jgi:hypothetical protein